MNIPYPEDYAGKDLRITFVDGEIIYGVLYGFNYDYTDESEEFLEFDVEEKGTGFLHSLTEDVIKSIEIL